MSPPRQPVRTYSPEAAQPRTRNNFERESPKQQYYNVSGIIFMKGSAELLKKFSFPFVINVFD